MSSARNQREIQITKVSIGIANKDQIVILLHRFASGNVEVVGKLMAE